MAGKSDHLQHRKGNCKDHHSGPNKKTQFKEKKGNEEKKSICLLNSKSVKLLKALEERRIQQELERRRVKDEIKANETPEQKRERRLKEKQEKEIRRRQRMGWDNEYQNYTNQDNPFGDSNLMSTFVWSKKLQKSGLKDMSIETVEVLSRQKQLENKLELEKVKKRRIERELERQAREEKLIIQQRSREAAQFHEWEQQEDKFHLEQAKLRSIIRIQDGRAKPIDLLAQYITDSKPEDAMEMQMHEPYYLLKGLSIKDLEDLIIDINVYIELEKGENIDFWNDMIVIVKDELQKHKKLNETVGGRREGIHYSVFKDVNEIFRNKSITQLNELRLRIENKIISQKDGIDISYWESLLLQLKAHMARARLRDYHQNKLRQKLSLLKMDSEVAENAEATKKDDCMKLGVEECTKVDISPLLCKDTSAKIFNEGSYSPNYMSSPSLNTFITIIDEHEDEMCIKHIRQNYRKEFKNDGFSQEELQMRLEAKKGMSEDELEFSVESNLYNSLQLSNDKYRPRKPRYFNRVHTGFEWNKYNQTHYDMDNPPPKIVQGYKFNIFYPDLIDKSKTPQYFLTQCEDNPDFAILRFSAGPPYEDIAFKIVHREWEFSYKRGFRCQFQNNIFQLWFHFKRYRYRR